MRTRFHMLMLLAACLMVACKQPNPDPPQPPTPPTPEDNMHHDSLLISDDLINNPERGFHVFKEFHSPNPERLTASGVRAIYENGNTLILNNYYLEDYRDCAIPESYLEVVRNNMQALRDGGCKCVLRFAYTSSENQYPHEAPVDTVLKHINQIKPILQEYGDVIFAMEAGFVGVWGEWYYTTYFKQNPSKDEDFVDRRRVLDALLDALPQDRQVCVRTPEFKLRCYGWSMADTITLAEAYGTSTKARLAAHDDAFMASESDMGTFTKAFHRKYWEAETRYTVYGGESCQSGKYANCENSLAQMEAMHISYLNISYHRGVIAGWQKEGCFEEMKRRIGYRLSCTDVATTKEPKAGEDLKVVLTIQNEGFSSPKNPRDIKVLLVNTADAKDVISVVPNSDPRYWWGGEEHKVEVTVKPQKAGNYKIYLYMPDPKPNLAADPRYAIRLANVNCWDETTGYNYLTTVKVN